MTFFEHSPFLEQAFKPFGEAYKNRKQLSIKEQEILYGVAFSFYETGNYEKATGFFTELVLSNPFVVSFWKGLASAKQMAQDYKAALHAWAIVCILDAKDPLPHFHAAENLYQLQEKTEALKALNCAEALLQKEQVALKQKIGFLKELYQCHGKN
ncbi:MAG TPA: tetratricopeptide repeat protein [Rhabdochlamydiaceae bacterium]|nr:tetratricopeptide repeat protein [Rhabdochlamydiaceae bacterium]